jgi:tetratricopeptide (TPR) repeat protein
MTDHEEKRLLNIDEVIEKGRKHRFDDDFEKALELFTRALAIDSSSVESLFQIGLTYISMENLDAAHEQFENALQLQPEFARGYFGKGAVCFYKDKFDESLEYLNRAIALAPEISFYYLRCRLHSRNENDAKAIEDRKALVRMEPQHFKERFARGHAFALLGHFDQAIDDFEEIICRGEMEDGARSWRAYCYESKRDYAAALDDLSYICRSVTDDCSLFFRRGFAFFSCERYEEAVADLDRSLGLSPENGDVLFYRGCALYQTGAYEEAVSDFDKAIELGINTAACFNWRGHALCELCEFEAAISDFDIASSIDPTYEGYLFKRGQCHLRLENLELALDDLNKAIANDPSSVHPLQDRASVWLALGEYEKADMDEDQANELRQKQLEKSLDESETEMPHRKPRVSTLLSEHLQSSSPEDLSITERVFPTRMRPDLQKAIEQLVTDRFKNIKFFGIKERSHDELNLSELLEPDHRNPTRPSVPQYRELDIGEDESVRCLRNGIWLLESDNQQFVVLMAATGRYGRQEGLKFQIATASNGAGASITAEFFQCLEDAVVKSNSYRGKILSLDQPEHYSGVSGQILVHSKANIARDDVILPAKTLELLDRNVISFAEKSKRLADMGLSTKKGLLFYGPPGTGKTHTIRYLANALEEHTTFLISAEQVALLSEYMVLARLLQPSMVVIEDVDLIARDRSAMESACEEVLLNKLLNEMDGLQANSNVIFVLTTNRPEALEDALASRPGRVDQAIEFPLPNDEGRRKLIQLYSCEMNLGSGVEDEAVKRTEGVSASFIKELMRRSAQFHLEHSDTKAITIDDVNNALEELLFTGGSLSRKLLGVQEES